MWSTEQVEIPLTAYTPASLFSTVYMNVMLIPKRRGYRYIVAARDDLSGATEGTALKKAIAIALACFF